jgi:hypothetical protein
MHPSTARTANTRIGWLAISLALALVLALLLFRTFAFNHRHFDNSGGTAYPNRVAPESNSAGSAAQNAGYGDVGGVKDHP